MSFLLGDPPGRIPHIVGSFARQALKDGLALQDTKGFNPYKFGFGAASDSHNTVVPYRQDNFFGAHGATDGTIELRMSGARQRWHGPARLGHGRPDRRVGRGEHARLDIRGDAAQGNLRRHRPAHQGAAVRRVGIHGGHAGRQGLGEDRLREGRADGRRSAAGQGQGADVRGLGGEGSDVRQPRPHPDRQGLEQERPELREDLRCRLGRGPQARQVDRRGAADRQHGRRRECHVHEHDRRGGVEDGVDRSRVRSEPARLLLRARAGDTDAALDDDPGQEARRGAAGCRARHAPGARVERRPSGTRRARKRARMPSRAPRWPT